ncbi:hypothetical protein BGZ83_010005 [Gryganskiella cystojenkinii]|nr:hypothetical protein BGZ83_010005 [Gryganskiella cystojenkinii]
MDSSEVRLAIGPFFCRADLAACVQVCRAWHDSFIGLIYFHIDIPSNPYPTPAGVQYHGHLIQSLSLTLCNPAPLTLTPLLEQILVTVRNLKSLTLTFKDRGAHETLWLEPEEDEWGNKIEVGTATTTTDESGIDSAAVPDASTGLKQILINNPDLRRLEISHLTTPTNLAHKYDEIQMPLQLEDLQYASTTSLVSWTLSDCLALFPLLDSIKYIIARTDSSNGTSGGIGNLSDIVALTEEERDRRLLSKLALKNLPLSTRELSTLLNSYPRLIELSLGGPRQGIMQVTMDEHLFHTLSTHPRFPYLTSLDLHDCHRYQGWMTQEILSSCSRLTFLAIATLAVDDLFTAMPGGDDIFWHWSCTSVLKRLRVRTLMLSSSDRARNNRMMDQLESLKKLEEIEIRKMARQTSQQSWTLRSEDPNDRLTKLCYIGKYTDRASLARDATLWWTVDVWPKLRRFVYVGRAEADDD